MDNLTITDSAAGKGEIVVYQPDEVTRLEVKVEDETVWLNRSQLALLFGRDVKTIGKHINNALREELKDIAVVANFATTAADGKVYSVAYYNLDMILSVGYRVKSSRGIRFRRWANRVLKEYLLKGYSLNQRLKNMEDRFDRRMSEYERRLYENEHKIDFFVRTSLPPVEGIFYDGQIFDAYVFVTNLIRSAKQTLVLIDNYIDESVLLMLSKRQTGVTAEIRSGRLTETLKQDLAKHNSQYPPITVIQNKNIHDRFLIVDDDVYHIGASLKDLGKKLFAFSKMEISPSVLTGEES
ncbi:MAG: virulence RhuM family protein [Bacteroidales bacterium]|nr:virulence RhuM family protein [Bacteroidales bacterium]